jgi:hypothetical protein
MLPNKTGSQPSRSSGASGDLLRDQARAGARQDNRGNPRHPIESCRSISLRRLDDARQPMGRWFLADIINVGEGGMCLIADEDQSLAPGQWLLMDLRAHPGFGQLRMQAQLRWLTRARFALTFGVAFETPLKAVPVLSVERRNERRDPNLEDWALEEEQTMAAT